MKFGRDLFRLYSNRETCYEYHDPKLGPIKIIITERLDEDFNVVSTSQKIIRDNYCIPKVTAGVMKQHSHNLNKGNNIQ